jgi:hypothetical protein
MGFRGQCKTIDADMVDKVAVSLGLVEHAPVLERKAVAEHATNGRVSPTSIVDTLIESMKRRRAIALE